MKNQAICVMVAALLISCTANRQAANPMIMHQNALHTWQNSDSTVSQRWQAVTTLLSPGMTYAQITKLLGEPTHPLFREHGLIVDCGPYESWGLEYHFPDGGVRLHMDGWQTTPQQEQWVFRSASFVGLSRPILSPSNGNDEIEVKIEKSEPATGRTVPPSAGASGCQ